MQPIFAKGNQRTVNKIISLRKEALAEHQYRVAIRLHAVMLSIEKHISGDISRAGRLLWVKYRRMDLDRP